MAKPFIVVWEGLDGAGKTTLMNKVREKLAEKGYSVATYKTPSDSPTGAFAKTYGNDPGVDPLTRMLLFLANTSDDSKRMRELVSEKTDFLFIDRYYLCSIVYGLAFLRTSGTQVGEEELETTIRLFEKLGEQVFLKPDLYVIVDAPEEDRVKRLKRKESQGGVESELERDLRMQNNVRFFYKAFAQLKDGQVIWIMNLEGRLEESADRLSAEIISRARKVG